MPTYYDSRVEQLKNKKNFEHLKTNRSPPLLLCECSVNRSGNAIHAGTDFYGAVYS